jgi:hypothetical protein
MKKTYSLLIACLIGLTCLFINPVNSNAQSVNINFSVFHNELARYGTWMHNPRFGRVCIYNEPGFRPYYSNGYWDYTNYGWTWVSGYEWGWAAFHYGRWEYDPYYGWMWIPGYEWAPAWVSWSESGDYYGWAPLGHGVNINISIGSIPHDRWVFCSRPFMNSRRFRDHCAPFSNNRVIVRNTTIINNVYRDNRRHYYSGPRRRDVERYARGPVMERRIDEDRRFERRDWDRDERREYNSRRERDRFERRTDERDNSEFFERGRNERRRGDDEFQRGRSERSRSMRGERERRYSNHERKEERRGRGRGSDD